MYGGLSVFQCIILMHNMKSLAQLRWSHKPIQTKDRIQQLQLTQEIQSTSYKTTHHKYIAAKASHRLNPPQ